MIKWYLLFIPLLFGSSFMYSEHTQDLRHYVEQLEQGNQTFQASKEYQKQRDSLVNNQAPFATVLTCSDSRVVPEEIFQANLGELFVIRNAGNVIDEVVIETIKYSLNVLGTRIIIVLGHQNCGAVRYTLESALNSKETQYSSKNYPQIYNKIDPALASLLKGRRYSSRLLQDAIKQNALYQAHELVTKSREIRDLYKEGRILILPAVYNLATGRIDWLPTRNLMDQIR